VLKSVASTSALKTWIRGSKHQLLVWLLGVYCGLTATCEFSGIAFWLRMTRLLKYMLVLSVQERKLGTRTMKIDIFSCESREKELSIRSLLIIARYSWISTFDSSFIRLFHFHAFTFSHIFRLTASGRVGNFLDSDRVGLESWTRQPDPKTRPDPTRY